MLFGSCLQLLVLCFIIYYTLVYQNRWSLVFIKLCLMLIIFVFSLLIRIKHLYGSPFSFWCCNMYIWPPYMNYTVLFPTTKHCACKGIIMTIQYLEFLPFFVYKSYLNITRINCNYNLTEIEPWMFYPIEGLGAYIYIYIREHIHIINIYLLELLALQSLNAFDFLCSSWIVSGLPMISKSWVCY